MTVKRKSPEAALLSRYYDEDALPVAMDMHRQSR